jgi:hypothetical protein
MTTHELKTEATYFDAVARGEKRFEIRYDDRGFATGLLILRRLHPIGTEDDGATPLTFRIGYLLRDPVGRFLVPGYVAFQLEPVDPAS